tara:strand:- start:481 stop:1305 length:825 start_codon:yes stop_codon:yes gene_type:complete
MQLYEFGFEAFDTAIYGRYVQPEDAKGVVVLAHGFAEHSGRYIKNVVPALLALQLAVVLYDNIGHGKSGGKRGHCPSYDALQEVLGSVINRASELFPNVPLFLYGHSMGGNLVLNYALRNDIALGGVVVTSPYLRLAFQPPKWKMILGRMMLRILPSITLASGLDPNGISRIPEAVEKYKADPLVFDQVSPMYSLPIMEAGEWAIANAGNLKVSALLLHGTADPIIDYRATEEFHNNSDKTTLKLFPGGYHELHHDQCADEMMAVVTNWLKNKL